MQHFENNVTSAWDEKGKQWLTNLPDILDILSEHWQLTEVTALDNLSYNYIVSAIQGNQHHVIVKIGCDTQSILAEYKALKQLNGQGIIPITDFNPQYNALLLPQLLPGNTLQTQYHNNSHNLLSAYSNVVKTIANNKADSSLFQPVNNWCRAIEKMNHNYLNERIIAKAKNLTNILLTTIVDKYVCHGDLHLDNIIQQEKNWLAIDPKGIVAEKAFEAAAFFLSDNILAIDKNKNHILSNIKKLAKLLDIKQQRLLYWIFIRQIISAQWFIEDNLNPDKALKATEYYYQMIEQAG